MILVFRISVRSVYGSSLVLWRLLSSLRSRYVATCPGRDLWSRKCRLLTFSFWGVLGTSLEQLGVGLGVGLHKGGKGHKNSAYSFNLPGGPQGVPPGQDDSRSGMLESGSYTVRYTTPFTLATDHTAFFLFFFKLESILFPIDLSKLTHHPYFALPRCRLRTMIATTPSPGVPPR